MSEENVFQHKPVEDAEITAIREAANGNLEQYIQNLTHIIYTQEAALSDSKRQLATMTARVEVADGQAAELDVQLSGAKREIGELKDVVAKAADYVVQLRESNIDLIAREAQAQHQLLTVTNELEGERKRWSEPAKRWRRMRRAVGRLIRTPAHLATIHNSAIGEALREIDKVAGEALSVASDLGPQPWPCPTGDPHSRLECAPIPMQLLCPRCGAIHLDEGEWATRPHKTHQCQFCQHEWRPFEHPTVGVLRK